MLAPVAARPRWAARPGRRARVRKGRPSPRQPVGQHGLHVMLLTRRSKPRRRPARMQTERVSGASVPAPARSPRLPVSAPPSIVPPAIVLNSPPTYIAFGYLLAAGFLLAFAKALTLFVAAGLVWPSLSAHGVPPLGVHEWLVWREAWRALVETVLFLPAWPAGAG